jgi:hypothetical protein
MQADELKKSLAAIEESAAKAREAAAVATANHDPWTCIIDKLAADACAEALGGSVIALPPGLLAALGEVAMAAEKVRNLSPLPDENALDTFERIGEDFMSETGKLRPGKDAGLGTYDDEDERAKRFAEWKTARHMALDAALARLRGIMEAA